MCAERTEEGIPIRTIYIPNVSINITNQMLCDYFRQYGAIERAQIVPERLKFFDILPAVGAGMGFVDQPPSQRNYFAYVTFVNQLGASEALASKRHIVQERTIEVEQAFAWNQPNIDVNKYLDKNQEVIPTEQAELLQSMDDKLNDDCILKIMGYLNIYDLARLAKFSPRFQSIAEQVHTVTIGIKPNSKLTTLMELRTILRLLGLGHSIKHLTISIKAFISQQYICDRLFQYIGPQLKSLTLESFSVTSEQFDLMKPMLINLSYLDIDLNYNFDYRRFNCEWPNLKTLRMRSSGIIDTFVCEEDSVPEFPLLTKLMIASGYRLHEKLFERLYRACGKILELVVINVDDLYSELAPIAQRTTDIQNLCKFTELTRLHLSFSRSYFNTNIIEHISNLKKLEHLTLELTNQNQIEDSIFTQLNNSLPDIGINFPNMQELRFSGISLNDEQILAMLRSTTKLKSIWLYECGITLTPKIIRNIVQIRRQFFTTTMGQCTPIILDLITSQPLDEQEVVANVLEEDDIKTYLKVQSNSNKNLINKGYIMQAENTSPRQMLRSANFRRHRFGNGNEPREHDMLRLRNRMFIFRP